MPLSSGTRLGPYEIVSSLGAGGMGEVYRARDGTLQREVALKVLPELFAADSDRLARFRREAQLLASLNHPNIAAIYGFEESTDVHALVLELVEGRTLADRIANGPIALDEALPIARQIAEALEAAHDRGIVHRDLKPPNIKLRPDGTVKVLDFGLAKLTEPGTTLDATATERERLSLSPTITSPAMMTGFGMILGTAAYMSPEQAKGRAADKRSDVWAFGCVLYEMLTGRQTFPNEETVSDTLAAILKGEPDWRALPAATPPRIRLLLERCLRKDLRRRLPDVGAVRIEIEEALSEPEPAVVSPAVPTRRMSAWRVVALASLLATLTLAAWIVLKPEDEPRVVHMEIFAPDRATIAASQPLSPDGRTIAFIAGPEGKQKIFVRPLDSPSAQSIPGTEDAERVVWSADSQNLAFFAHGKLQKVASAGGLPSRIADIAGRDAAWSAGNVILIGGQGKGLVRVSALGGQPVPVTELEPGETTHDYPDFLPDGRHFLYMARRSGPNREGRDVFVGSLDSKERVLLPGIRSGTRYSPTGHVLFLRDGTLMAQRFDVKRLELTGDAFPIAEQVLGGVTTSFSVSTNGSLAYVNTTPSSESQLAWFDRQGKQVSTMGAVGRYGNAELSPNGKMVAFSRDNEVLLFDIERNQESRFISDAAANSTPNWSPDSGTIAFSANRETNGNAGAQNAQAGNLYQRAVGVVGEETLLLKTDAVNRITNWSRDHIIYVSAGDIWALPIPVSGDPKPLRVTDTSFTETQARVSPDGRSIAYVSNESGNRFAVFVQSFPERGAKKPVSAGDGTTPRWNPAGGELFYIEPEPTNLSAVSAGTLMSVPVKTVGRDLQVGTPVPLFPIRGGFIAFRDGRFLLNVTSTAQGSPPITVIQHWGATLKK